MQKKEIKEGISRWSNNHHKVLITIAITLISSLSLISLGLWLYASKIGGIGFWSQNSEDWGSFGGFISGIIGVPATIFSGILIYVTVKMQIDQNKNSQNKQILMVKTEELLHNLSQIQNYTFKLYQTVEIDMKNYEIDGHVESDDYGTPHLVNKVNIVISDEQFQRFNNEVDDIVEVISKTRVLNELYFSSNKDLYKKISSYLREVDRYLDWYSKKVNIKLLGNPFRKTERKQQYIEIRTKLKENLGLNLSYMDEYVLNKTNQN